MPTDLRLPQLEGLVPELHPLLRRGNVDEKDVVDVHEDGLVADDEFFELVLLVSHHIDVCVGDVQLVLPLHEEVVVHGIELVELN